MWGEMKLRVRRVEEEYSMFSPEAPVVTYTYKELYRKSSPHGGTVDLGDTPEIEELLEISGHYQQLWKTYGAAYRHTCGKNVQRGTLEKHDAIPDMSKIPRELTDLLKKLPEKARRVVGDEF